MQKTSLQSLFNLDIKSEIYPPPPQLDATFVPAWACVPMLICVFSDCRAFYVADPSICECAVVVAQLGQRFRSPVTAMR